MQRALIIYCKKEKKRWAFDGPFARNFKQAINWVVRVLFQFHFFFSFFSCYFWWLSVPIELVGRWRKWACEAKLSGFNEKRKQFSISFRLRIYASSLSSEQRTKYSDEEEADKTSEKEKTVARAAKKSLHLLFTRVFSSVGLHTFSVFVLIRSLWKYFGCLLLPLFSS